LVELHFPLFFGSFEFANPVAASQNSPSANAAIIGHGLAAGGEMFWRWGNCSAQTVVLSSPKDPSNNSKKFASALTSSLYWRALAHGGKRMKIENA